MKTNLAKRTIELTKAEMKAAMIYGKPEYDMLQAIRRDYPGFTVVEEKAKRGKSDFAGLDMNAIRAYVTKYGTDEQQKNFDFICKRGIDGDGKYHETQSFFEIKKWFLNEFKIQEQRENYLKEVQKIYENASKNVA